jgi:YqaJ-like viral recombinase domain
MTKEELEAMGIFGVESESELAVKSPEKTHEFAQNHHGMMSGSSIGLVIIEPASDAEINDAKDRLRKIGIELASKGLLVFNDAGNVLCSEEVAKANKAITLWRDYGVASRALAKLENSDFSQTAKSYLDEIVSQRRRVFNPERPRAFKGNAATEWGNGKELEAIAAYEALTGLKLEKTGDKQEFVRLGYVESVDFDFSEWFGCTPDSLLSSCNDWLPCEFKNPSSGVVFDRYRELKNQLDLKKENALYYWQCVSQMACLDAPYAQWIAYDCDIKKEYCKTPADRFVIIDFERDLAAEKVLIDSLYKAVQYIQERI